MVDNRNELIIFLVRMILLVLVAVTLLSSCASYNKLCDTYDGAGRIKQHKSSVKCPKDK